MPERPIRAHRSPQPVTRRDALCRIGNGFGMLAFASLVGESIVRAAGPEIAGQDGALDARKLDHPARARHVIFLFMNGGLSQVDSFDPKPMLDKYHGQPLPGGSIATERKTGALMRSPFTFKKYGRCGMDVSELFPYVGECADDICWIRSVCTDIPNHEPSMLMMNTGHTQVGRPSLGSWLTYGLGTDNKNLPGYVVLCPEVPTTVGPPLWNSAFLPATHQGTYIPDKVEKQDEKNLVGKDFDPKKLISYISNEKFTLTEQRRELDLLQSLNRLQMERDAAPDPQLEATIQSMEVAYRMQTEAPDVFDVRKESEATLKLYGPGSTARGCLTAVRLVQRGVRMVQVYYGKGDPWDAHADIQAHRKNARDSDQPFAAVIKDRVGVRPHASDGSGRRCRHDPERTRSQSVRFHDVARRRRRQGRDHLRRDGRFRLQGHREACARARSARDDSLSARHRPHEADVPLQRARFPAHRRLGQRHPRPHRLGVWLTNRLPHWNAKAAKAAKKTLSLRPLRSIVKSLQPCGS